MKRKYINLIAIPAVLLVVGISGVLYVQRSNGDIPTVTVDGKPVTLVEERYFGKMGENKPLADLIKEKGIKPVVVSNISRMDVEFASLDHKSYNIIEGDDHGWISDRIQNGTTMIASCPTGSHGQQDKEWLVKVSENLNYGDKVYEFVLRTE